MIEKQHSLQLTGYDSMEKLMWMMMLVIHILMFCILQWDARSLIANSKELKRFVDAF